MGNLLQDLRYAFRMLAKNPSFAFVVVILLGLGIGVNATVFCWMRTIVLNPLPGVRDPGGLVTVVQSGYGSVLTPRISYPSYHHLAGLDQVFQGVIGTSASPVVLNIDGQSEWADARVATSNVFELLRVHLEMGRSFLPEEEQSEGGHPVLVISHGLWQRDFSGDPNIVGRTVRVNQHVFTIVGVTPPEFQGVSGGARTDVWAPLSMHDAVLNYGSYSSRTFGWIQPLARLRPGVGIAQARAALDALSMQLQNSYPDSNRGVEFKLFPLWRSPYGGQGVFLAALSTLLAVAFALLLIVVANVSCLQLTSASNRGQEVAIRLALGAGRSLLIQQFLVESLLLALAGGCLGIVLASFAVNILKAFIPRAAMSFAYDFRLDYQTLTFTMLLTLATAVLFGLAPALKSSRGELLTSLRGGARGSGPGFHDRRVLNGLVIAEVALAFLLLVAAGLCVKGFQRATRLDLGFDAHNVLYASLNLVPSGYTADRGKVFDRELRARLASLPGVTDAAFVNTPPLSPSGTFNGVVDVEGHEVILGESRLVSFIIASPGYFSVMRVPILAGRDFTDQDDAARPNVAVVDITMAERFWPGLNPLGRQFHMAVGVAPSDTFTIIGVAANGKYNSLSEPPTPLVYVTSMQRPLASLFMNVLLRTQVEPEQMVPALRREIHALDPDVQPIDAMTLEEYIRPAFIPVRMATTFLAILGLTALFLASLGLYGVMAYTVSGRWREIGIRIALGARAGDVLRDVLVWGMTMVAAGAAAGLALALGLTPLLAKFLYGVSSTDKPTYAGATVLLGAVALMACYIPARRATKVDPMVALRYE